jgi:predicted DNA-binding protein YlxM (UPF0122 family)
MGTFLDQFPKIAYNINKDKQSYSNFELITNIFFRIGVIREVLQNTASYYVYEIEDGDTPELLAEKVYNDPYAYWMILYANNMSDPQYDWPLDYDQFNKYIIGKYGSIETAKITVHHYEKVVTRTELFTGTVTENKFIINQEKLTDNDLDVPYDYYQGDGSLPETQSYNVYNVNDRSIEEIIRRNSVTCYDWEYELNEKKRLIKVIKSEYYPRIMAEFNKLTGATPSYVRKFA